MAYFASNTEEPEPLAWKILQSRLGVAEETQVADEGAAETEADDVPSEEPTQVTSVITQPDRDLVLFESATPPHQGMSTFGGSLVVHALAGALLWFGLAYRPPNSRVITERYNLRQLDLEMLAELEQARVPHPDPLNAPVPNKPRLTAPAPSHSIKTPVERLQPLIQPDLPNTVKMAQQIPVPRIVLWSASNKVVQKITPPTIKRPAANAIPVLDRPNQEIRIADVAISSNSQLALKSQVIPSTTLPVADRNAIQVQQLSSVSQIAAASTPAAILSLSDIQLVKGTAELPPVTAAPKSDARTGLAAGQGKNTSTENGNGSGKSEAGGDELTELTVTPFALSQEGHFSAVIVGNDLAEDYPELAGLWAGRATYTVYLHVGLSKAWTLQYGLPRDAKPAAAGAVTRLDPPWAYSIVRPNLPPGSINADALMIHGFINASGKFENLSVAFPQPFPIAQFVLHALQQWQFRPATRDGQAAKVEVLLIIPDQDE
ncbi:MAG: hypothetical protein ACLQMO_05180 [Acidobacteriaceae bacterium]